MVSIELCWSSLSDPVLLQHPAATVAPLLPSPLLACLVLLEWNSRRLKRWFAQSGLHAYKLEVMTHGWSTSVYSLQSFMVPCIDTHRSSPDRKSGLLTDLQCMRYASDYTHRDSQCMWLSFNFQHLHYHTGCALHGHQVTSQHAPFDKQTDTHFLYYEDGIHRCNKNCFWKIVENKYIVVWKVPKVSTRYALVQYSKHMFWQKDSRKDLVKEIWHACEL